MQEPHALRAMALPELVESCHRETQKFFKGQTVDDRYCFELFHRALIMKESEAWEAVFAVYGALVRGWLKRSGDTHQVDLSLEDLMALSFEKLWYATRHLDNLGDFRSLRALLHYLKACCSSVLVDALRGQQRRGALAELSEFRLHALRLTLEEEIGLQDERAQLWKRLDCLLRDDQERLLMRATYQEGLRARNILDTYPGWFYDVNDIYRVRRAIMARLRGARNLAEVLGLSGS